ncbi:hypothetical protein ILUMI_08350 [Ignelater luminosus]|uniref:THAP-type domain-containing protein n=1 Tax=Ignelater luminosus TaxID=2038154 RepID=A0A8K0D719_IGNLU|nr:hypothetical protein ILUMI_08350 [Ignelater luminosus]
MPRNCVAPGCGHHQQVCSLKRFPVNPVRLQKWVENMNKKNWMPHGLDRICECHFDENQFEGKSNGSKKLRSDAVPTIFNKKKLCSRKTKSQLQLQDNAEHEVSNTIVKVEIVDEPAVTFEEVYIPTNSQENEQKSDIQYCEDIEIKKENNEPADAAEQMLTDSSSNTLCTNKNCEKIRKENRQLKKKLAKLRKGLDRLINRYDAMGDTDNVEYYIISDVAVKEES